MVKQTAAIRRTGAMRFSRQTGHINGQGMAASLILSGLLGVAFSAPGAPDAAAPPAPASAAANTAKPVQDIIRLTDAGVSKGVIIAHIENAAPYVPTVDEIIALKKHDVADEITAALVKRGAERPRPVPPRSRGLSQRGPINYRIDGPLDPESYEFWWYHYAYPRTLSYAYERLYPYSPLTPSPYFRPAPFSSPGYRSADFPPWRERSMNQSFLP